MELILVRNARVHVVVLVGDGVHHVMLCCCVLSPLHGYLLTTMATSAYSLKEA
ncbi:hypothetical protein BDR05DRAFT_958410 [Suillus weaverae]|nr:hypothetical protein BDR05DRAFT_958410 [Suillus weaverae]